jgi:N-acetylmuramate 1-kinase
MTLQEELIAFARESLELSPEVETEIAPLAGRGSDRAYYRFRWNAADTAILVHYQPGRIENTYYGAIAAFLLEQDIPVPQTICHDEKRCFLIMKDLGNADLWSLRDSPWEIRRIQYQKTLTIAHRLHSIPEQQFPSDRIKLAEAFGLNLYRWEHNYFRDNFVNGLCKIEFDPAFERELDMELASLAERLACDKRCLVHRDLQSQNVMIYENNPFLIDFQGMRFGSRFYDLGSLLCDPYVSMAGNERKELLSFYRDLSTADLDWDSYQDMFWDASAQRLMQALGAYGFLGITKGLKNYLAHVPAGLRNLRSAAENAVSLPRLLEICARCEKALYDSNFESRISNLR